jgi:spermidine synthase
VFGNSVWSAALILSSFMAGLALGNAIAARIMVHRFQPLRIYAVLEVTIAVAGCTIVFGLPLLGDELRPIFQMLWNHDNVINGIRLVASFCILLVPTTAMGLTLPLLLDDSALRRHDFARAIGLLYGANTLGAVAGALLGEAYLIKAFGLWGTSLVAGGINCIAATIAFVLARDWSVTSGSHPSRAVSSVPQKVTRLPWRLLFLSLGTGGILLCLEVVWFRFLRLYVASSSTAFALMLATVLAGIGLGGVASGAIPRRVARSSEILPVLLMLAAIGTLLSYSFFPIPKLGEAGNFYLESWQEIWLPSLALMFPVAFLSGILLPSIVAGVQTRVQNRMNSAGITTLFNTAGAAAGPLLASLLLLPNIGFQWSLLLCAGAYALLAVLVSERPSSSLGRMLGAATLGLGAALILIIVVFPYHRDQMHFANAQRLYVTRGEHLAKRIEGTSDTYQLLRRDLYGQPYYYRLTTNAFSMASTESRNQRYMKMFAYLPLTLRPEAEEALLICYGCGMTADALVHASNLKRIDIVDISKEVFALASFFSGPNHSNPLRDPRVTTFIQDGRFFLQASPRQYDIITGEPPPPKVAGTVNLYTQQFFSLINDRLKQGGIATFWLPIYELKVDETKAILRAFHNVFPNASVWANADHEWIMMGIKGPGRRMKEEEIRRLWNDPVTSADLARVGIECPEQVGALFLMDSKEIEHISRDVEPLTDFYPKRLSDAPPDIEEARRFAWPYMEASPAYHAFLSSPLIDRIWPETMKKSLGPFFVFREARYLSEIQGSNKLAELDLYLRHSQLRAPVLEVLRTDEFALSLAEELARASATLPSEILSDLVAGALARRDIAGAVSVLEQKRDRGIAVRNEIFLLIYLDCLNGKVDTAEALAAAEIRPTEKDWLVDWLWEKLQAEFGFHPPS